MGSATGREIFGVIGAIILLAGFAVAVKNGTGVASILQAGGQSFSQVINAATHG